MKKITTKRSRVKERRKKKRGRRGGGGGGGGIARILWKVVMYTTYVTCEITLYVAQNVNTEQLQHCIP